MKHNLFSGFFRKIKHFGIIAFIVLVGLSTFTACGTIRAVTEPEDEHWEIPAQYKWNLASIYETEAHWEADLALLEDELIPRMASYRGTLNNKENTLACLKAYTEARMVLEKVHAYATLNFHKDMSNPSAQELQGRAAFLEQQFIEAASYINPELAKKDDTLLRDYISDPDFEEYKSFIDYIVKSKQHILTEDEAALLALATIFLDSPEDIFSMFYNVDLQFDSYEPYKEFNNTFAAILAAEVNKNIFLARAYNYNSALEASLNPDIPVRVYENLISSSNKGILSLHKYYRLLEYDYDNKEFLDQIDYLLDYWNDIYYEEAQELVLNALKPLGEEYGQVLDTAFNNNWIDVYHTPNKRSGAYCKILYRPHPFILMNYDDTFDGVSTLAHELGHAVHIYYSSISQPFNDFPVQIFTAEVAATLNEILLYKYVIANAATNAEKILLIFWLLHLYSETFFTQIRYAEFEKQIHERGEAGNILNAETLNNIWADLDSKYRGDSNEADCLNQYTWASIPHFYQNFYVYQYATSIAAASALVSGITENRPGALDSYLEFLHSGSKYDPIRTLANLGLDMTSPQVFDKFVEEFDSLVNELEQLMRLEGLIASD